MKKLLFVFALMLGVTFTSCGITASTVPETDSTVVEPHDSISVDTIDSIVVDSIVAE